MGNNLALLLKEHTFKCKRNEPCHEKSLLFHISCIPDEKYKLIQGVGQGQKYCSDPDALTLLF